jgi:hypothetical protein
VGSIWTAGAAALILALAFLTISSSSAFAAAGHSALRTISTGPTSTPRAVAADSGGNLYVLEMGGRRVEKFDSTGNPVPFVASAPYVEGNKLIGTVAGPFPEFLPWRSFNIGVDNSGGPNDGNIYLAIEREEGASAVLVYAATGAYLGRLGGTGEYRCAVAVNPTDGSVFVGQGGGLLRYPTPSGTLEAAIPNGELHSGACPVAADSAGAVYVGDGPIRKYAASQFDVASPTPSLEFESGSSLGLALDPTNGDLYADKGGKIIKWNAAGTQQGEPFGQLSDSRGLAVDSAQNISAVDSGGGVFVFGPDEVQLPAGTTGGSSNLTPIGADVEGSVDPDGAGDITACEFRYGEDTGYSAGSAPCAPGAPISSPSSVSATLSGLVSGTTYHYRLFLTNANGTQMSTGDQTFTTPPATESVATGQASAVEKDRAQLNGSYTGDGQEVHYFFEWGKTNGYGHTTPAPPDGNAGTASGPQNVAPVQISGLEPTTTYHYRLVVSTASGITRGQDETLTTGVAVDNLTADAPTVVADTSAELRASFDGDGNETHYYFEWGPTRDYGSTTPAPPGNAVPGGSGRIEVPPVSISGLESGSTYHFRVVASNSVGTTVSGDQSFRAAEAPLVGNLNTRNVKPTSAELTGEINPRFGQTSYRFDWGPTATYGNSVPVPAGNAGSGDSLVPVSAQLEGLTPGATYHFRLVATNQFGTTTSADQTFGFFPPACPNSQLRQETRSNDLPDCRAYELVTPSFAQGAEIMPAAGPTSGLAINPARIAYAVNYGTFAASTGEGTNSLGDLYVSTRSDSGWTQRYNGLPGSQAIFMGGPPGAVLYSPSNTLSSAESQRGTQASPTLDRVISYNWGYPGQITWKSVGSNAPYVWEASSGRLIERWPSNLAEVGDEHFAGIPQASADLSHFVFSSNVVFADGGTARDEEIACCSGNYSNNAVWPRSSIYDNDLATRTVALASVRSDGTPFEGRAFDISADGSHILMTEEANLQGTAGSLLVPREAIAGAEITGPLFLRVDGTRTYEIAPGHQIQYAGSSADGATVYLSSDDQLTPDDHDTSRDLFVWHESDPNLLTRVSIGNHGNAGNTDECAPNEGWSTGCGASIIAIKAPRSPAGAGGNGYTDNFLASKSGDLYFESPEQLVGLKGELGERNIYLYRGGTLRYVATMEPSRRILRMQVTPDGRYMALVTGSSLTEYNSGGHWEMYLYGSDSGRVACVSCRPDGQQPVSDVRGSQNGLFLTYDGRAFFSSMDSLVPRDTNEALDIYEFTEGKAQLITSGTGAERGLQSGPQNETGLVNVSANGTDVYFATIDNLVTQDHNGAQIKVYDARTGGGFPAEREATKCVAADECHGAGNSPPAPPADRTSANFGTPHKAKSHKAKKHKKAHKHGKHKKKKRAGKSKSKRQSNGKQGGMRHG